VLHVHRATRADVLATALAELLREPPADPFAPDLVAVPTRGMERWLTQTMSSVLGASPDRADGVCANVLFPTPHRLVSEAVASASGLDPETDPWLPERATWPLLDVVQENLEQPWLQALAAYLGAVPDSPDPVKHERRLSIVRHLAGLFDRYALNRPQMLADWLDGGDAGAGGVPLSAAATWQPELWRRLRARIAVPGPAERRALACERLIADPAITELPARLALFGLTRLPVGQLQVLRALADGRDVHLFLLHPSPALWSAIAAQGPAAVPPDMVRTLDRTGALAANQLLASWGRDARETQLVLAREAGADPAHPEIDEEHPLPAAPVQTLLRRLQADVHDDRGAPGAPLADEPDGRAELDPGDRSVVVHSCHGRVRQVEVLRDAILHALAADPTLEPRDVIVMCPDVESYAPLIQATFGAEASATDGPDPGPAPDPGAARPADAPRAHAVDLRVRLADRSLTQTNPLLGVVSQLLEIGGTRVTASQVLDLADRGPVRRRFGFDDDDLTRLQEWITGSGVRWGLDAEHRAPYQLSAVPDGTWRSGLDRLLLGVTMTEDGNRLFGSVLPLDDVDSRSIELAGRLAELIERLTTVLDGFGERQTLAEWAGTLAHAADALALTAGRERWQRAELQRILDEMVGEAGPAPDVGVDVPGPRLAPAEVRAHLAARLAGHPTRANFRTGHLTVCTLMPMRSVPHRIVCLLGLDDDAFPRRAPRDGDDLMLEHPHIGERDPRSEDRQLLLDALLAAREQLIVTFTGNDERTNTRRPPAVPIGELLDAVDATVRCDADPAHPASEQILVRHPLQPFDPRNFAAGQLAGADPWSFDEVALRGARALSGRAGTGSVAAPFLDAPLPPLPTGEIELDDLVAFVSHPVRAFLRRRLEISLRDSEDEVADALPIELDGLERWDVANRLLEALLRGTSFRVAVAAEKARGTLPPGTLADGVVDSVSELVIALATEASRHATAGADRDPIDVRVALSGGRTLSGTVTGVSGDVLLSASYSRVAPRHRIAAWVRLLAVTAAHPEEPFTAVTIGRGHHRDDVLTCRVDPLAEDPADRRAAAVAELEILADLYDRGMREPLPLYSRTSAAWAQAAATAGGDPRDEARQLWESRWKFDGEDADLYHQLVLGPSAPFTGLLTGAPADGEAGEGWVQEETTRFGRLARRLWDGLLDREQRSAR
jgi:exodeoxyribonuclease V gamma subunit